MAFDVEGARAAGYSEAEIADHLGKSKGFNVAGARKSGYSDADILSHLGAGMQPTSTAPAAPARPKAPITDNLNAETLNPTGSTLENIGAGAGKAVVDLWRGVKQIGAKAGNAVGLVSDATKAGVQADVDEAAKRDAALMDTGGGIAGNIGGTVATMLLPGAALKTTGGALAKLPSAARAAEMLVNAGRALNAPTTFKGAAAGGATLGALGPVTSEEGELGRLKNMAVGGAGGAGGMAAGRAVSAAYQGGKALIEPFTKGGQESIVGRTLQRFVDDPASVAARLRAANAPAVGPFQPGQARATMGEIVPGSLPTTAEASGSTALATLTEALKSANPQVKERFANVAAGQNAARLDAMGRIAPVAGTPNEAAQAFGGIYDSTVPGMEKAAGKRVSAAFDGIDPFGEVKIQLPIDEMRAARDKFLGPGTFGTGNKTAEALREAEQIGLENVTVGAPKNARSLPQTLAQAVRKAGGLRADGTGELASLTNKGSGSSGLVNRNGMPSDLMAEEMAARGFIKNADPDALVQALEGGFRGRGAIANDTPDTAFEALRAAIQGGGEGGQVPKALPFQTIQNFRSSLGEAAQQARMAGNKQEAAALRQMATEIENRVAAVADGGGSLGEAFSPDQVLRWREALKLHADKMQRFHTGPQKAGFRTGGDGQPMVQGAEWAPRFFNSAPSQADDMRAFSRVAGGDESLADALKSYAMTKAANVGAKGELLPGAMRQFRTSHDGALRELLSSNELNRFGAVADDVARSANATARAGASGSNTAQNLSSMNLLRQILGPLGLPESFAEARMLPTLMRPAAWALKSQDQVIQDELGRALMTPGMAAQLLEKVQRQAAPGRLSRNIQPLLAPAGTAAALVPETQ